MEDNKNNKQENAPKNVAVDDDDFDSLLDDQAKKLDKKITNK